MFEAQRVVNGQVLVDQAMARTRSDEDELELAVREHARLVYRVAYSVLRNHHDAEDATQEAFVRVLRYRRKLAGVRDPRSWLARVAWRVAIERRRRIAEEVSHDDLDQVVRQIRSLAAGAEEIVLGEEMTGFLEKLIAGLPGKLRDPLTLSTVEEMSPADIAAVLGINEAAVRSRLFRARRILREKLAVLLEGKHGA
jgi:RNA polymerase sigma-70 factor (ECF subfamily)